MATPRKKPADKLKVGRKSIYSPTILKQVEKLILLGAKDDKLIDFIGIDSATFYRWQNKYPEFRELILRGKEKFDSTVAVSLYQKANGYKHKATKIFFNADLAKLQIMQAAAAGEPPPKEPGIVRADYVERYAPDTNAIAFYLTNRRSQTWKNRNNTNIDADIKGTVQHNVEWEAAPGCEPLAPPNELTENEQ